jgi:hypothetical protein
MTLSVAEQVRLRIQDPFRYETETVYGDGTASAFKLRQGQPYSTLSATATASIATTAGWSATGCTVNHSHGRVIFSGVISANSAIQTDYFWSVFGDAEIGQFTADGGTVVGASLEAVKTLMFDAWKRARWAAPDGTNYDDTQAFANLATLKSALHEEQAGADELPAGETFSWAEEQENWG